VPATTIGSASGSDRPAPSAKNAMYAAIIITSPWAKLIRRRIPKTIASPTAISA
jgi:hypothetical protein